MKPVILPFHDRVRVTSPYGERFLNGGYDWHSGIDLVGVDDITVYAASNGVVIASTIVTDSMNRTWEWGNFVCVESYINGKVYHIYYCHLAKRLVSVGETIEQGDALGIMGNTGYSFGAHTHFEMREYNRQTGENVVDPSVFLQINNKVGVYMNDNIPHSWAKDDVQYCIDKGIIRGDGAQVPNYRLFDNPTREEVCVILRRALEIVKKGNI